MVNETMKEIKLKEGDSLSILPETKEFLLGCCNCGLIHLIKIKRTKNDLILQFFKYKQ